MATQLIQKQTLPELGYDYGALEPVISGEIMEIHHKKHHQAYVTNLNNALEKYAEAEEKNDVAGMIALQNAINFNGGGHVNHSIFWTILAPTSQGGGQPPEGSLAQQIEKDFGSLQNLIDDLSAKTIAIQGSGWGWLGYDKKHNRLITTTRSNQDPLSTFENNQVFPIIGIDVWEHAYYLQYKNVRPEYVKSIWQVINWKEAARRFEQATR